MADHTRTVAMPAHGAKRMEKSILGLLRVVACRGGPSTEPWSRLGD